MFDNVVGLKIVKDRYGLINLWFPASLQGGESVEHRMGFPWTIGFFFMFQVILGT